MARLRLDGVDDDGIVTQLGVDSIIIQSAWEDCRSAITAALRPDHYRQGVLQTDQQLKNNAEECRRFLRQWKDKAQRTNARQIPTMNQSADDLGSEPNPKG